MGKITHPCVSLFLPSPDDSETLQVPDSKLYGAPVLAKEGGLSLGQGPAFSRLRLKRGIVLGWGPRTPPLLFLSRCSNILSVPTGAIWPHLLLLGAYRLHTAGKGMNLSRSPSLSQATPWGVTPPILFPPPGRRNQDRRVDSVLQLWPQCGKEGSDYQAQLHLGLQA